MVELHSDWLELNQDMKNIELGSDWLSKNTTAELAKTKKKLNHHQTLPWTEGLGWDLGVLA